MIALRDGHPVDVHHESGLLGAPDSSSDMRVILERRSRDERSALAFEMFCYQSKKAIGALAAALGGVDNLVFTGGIGEQAPPVRERICAGLRSIGIRLDATRNRSEAPDIISADDSPCTIWVKGADEELVIFAIPSGSWVIPSELLESPNSSFTVKILLHFNFVGLHRT